MKFCAFLAMALMSIALDKASACGSGCRCMTASSSSGCSAGMPVRNQAPQGPANHNGHKGHAEQADDTTLVAIAVSGMTCNACAAKVQKALAAVPGVSQVQVDLRRNLAVVTADAECDEKALL